MEDSNHGSLHMPIPSKEIQCMTAVAEDDALAMVPPPKSNKPTWLVSSFSTSTNSSSVRSTASVERVKTAHGVEKSKYESGPVQAKDTESKRSDFKDPWIVKYAPKTKKDLAVHGRKILEVENWLSKACQNPGPHVLLISGPAGCGKTATVKTLTKHLSCSVTEWTSATDIGSYSADYRAYVTQATEFERFLCKAGRYNSVCGNQGSRIILIDELPYVFSNSPNLLHDILRKYAEIGRVPVIFVFSQRGDEYVKQYKLFPDKLLSELRIDQIKFNPLAKTLMMEGISRIFKLARVPLPGKKIIEDVILLFDGDIRGAINALQLASSFSCSDTGELFDSLKKNLSNKPPKRSGNSTGILLSTVNRDPHLSFFQCVGRVLNAKRYAASSTSTTTNEVARFDALQVINENLNSASHFIGTLQENYIKSFTGLENVHGATDCLSFVDIILSDWKQPEVSHNMGLTAGVMGMMEYSRSTSSGRFTPATKSQWPAVRARRSERIMMGNTLFAESGCATTDIYCDIIPSVIYIQAPDLSQEQRQFAESVRRLQGSACGFSDVVSDEVTDFTQRWITSSEVM